MLGTASLLPVLACPKGHDKENREWRGGKEGRDKYPDMSRSWTTYTSTIHTLYDG